MFETRNGYIGHFLEVRANFLSDAYGRGSTGNKDCQIGISSGFRALPANLIEKMAEMLGVQASILRNEFMVDGTEDVIFESVYGLIDQLSEDGWILRAFDKQSWTVGGEHMEVHLWMFQRRPQRGSPVD
ncbi:MAG TPA: hypothetical protein VMP08_01000 [Anaerolineae bacterium]|nr:hypothetical protein [Anaerolineae bacterium]